MSILYCENCLNVLEEMPTESIDMVMTSPPYDDLRNYNHTLNWSFDLFKNIAIQLCRVIKKGGVIVWVVADKTLKGSETGTSFKQALFFKELGLNLYDTMIYKKKNYAPLNHRRYEQEFEYMFVFSKGKPKTFNPILEKCKYANKDTFSSFRKTDNDELTTFQKRKVKETKIKGNIFEYTVGNKGKNKINHPAQFPLDLPLDQVKSWSNENDIVLDPFMGSGTTGVACEILNRKFIGIEINKEYFDIASSRLEEKHNI